MRFMQRQAPLLPWPRDWRASGDCSSHARPSPLSSPRTGGCRRAPATWPLPASTLRRQSSSGTRPRSCTCAHARGTSRSTSTTASSSPASRCPTTRSVCSRRSLRSAAAPAAAPMTPPAARCRSREPKRRWRRPRTAEYTLGCNRCLQYRHLRLGHTTTCRPGLALVAADFGCPHCEQPLAELSSARFSERAAADLSPTRFQSGLPQSK